MEPEMIAAASQDTLDVDERIAQTGCVEQYGKLENCLDQHDRVWSKCQNELREFARCMKVEAPGTKTDTKVEKP